MHVCNDRNRFTTYTPTDSSLKTDDSITKVEGIGTVELRGVDPITDKEKAITLSNALYSPGFHTNLVSYGALKKRGGRWDEDGDCIRDPNGIPVVSLKPLDSLNLWAFDIPHTSGHTHAHAVRRSEQPLEAEASAEIWHRRLGHVAPRVVRKTADMVDGIKIKGNPSESIESESTETDICEVCKLSHAPRQISRRPIARHSDNVAESTLTWFNSHLDITDTSGWRIFMSRVSDSTGCTPIHSSPSVEKLLKCLLLWSRTGGICRSKHSTMITKNLLEMR